MITSVPASDLRALDQNDGFEHISIILKQELNRLASVTDDPQSALRYQLIAARIEAQP